VTPDEGTDNRHPAISPDGRTLAFWSRSDAGSEIILQDLLTGEHTVLVLDPAVQPATGDVGQNLEFSPDGKSLLFVAAGNIYVADIKKVR
jgi:Tol biopolymer transport system component